MKIIYIVLLSIIIPSTVFEILKEESTIQWKGTKSTGSYHDGLINIDNGFVNIEQNNIIAGKIIIDMNSITCTDIEDPNSNKYLVEHLKNDDFFSVAEFPLSILEFNKITHIKHDDYSIIGELTIKNQTYPIEFIANIKIHKNTAVASGSIEINRAQYGIKYKSKTWHQDLGDRFINDIFELYFNLIAKPKS